MNVSDAASLSCKMSALFIQNEYARACVNAVQTGSGQSQDIYSVASPYNPTTLKELSITVSVTNYKAYTNPFVRFFSWLFGLEKATITLSLLERTIDVSDKESCERTKPKVCATESFEYNKRRSDQLEGLLESKLKNIFPWQRNFTTIPSQGEEYNRWKEDYGW